MASRSFAADYDACGISGYNRLAFGNSGSFVRRSERNGLVVV